MRDLEIKITFQLKIYLDNTGNFYIIISKFGN